MPLDRGEELRHLEAEGDWHGLLQVAARDHGRVAIATGKLRVGDQLPTVRQLAVELRINANTVAKVYAELERAGVVETRRGVGTFVRQLAGEQGVTAEEMERQFFETARPSSLLKRFIDPQEVAHLVAYVCSPL